MISKTFTNGSKRYGTYHNHRYRRKIHRKFFSDRITFQNERKAAPKIGDTITPKNRQRLRGVDEKYIQWNEILRDVLNGKLKIVQNKKTESDFQSEEGEIEVILRITTHPNGTVATARLQHHPKMN